MHIEPLSKCFFERFSTLNHSLFLLKLLDKSLMLLWRALISVEI